MKHYDLRVIDDCLVYSYEVEAPHMPITSAQEMPKQNTSIRKKKKQMFAANHLLLKLFLICLMPFALVIDGIVSLARYTFSAVSMVFQSSRKYMPALGTLSCLILASLLFYYL